MNKMKIKFLGTSTGVTEKERFHSSLLLKTSDKNILIDVGDGSSKSLLSHNISLNSITDIIISHSHADHLAGLPSLLTQMKLSGRTGSLNIYSSENLIESFKELLKYFYIFPEHFPFELNFCGWKENEEINITDNLSLLPRQNTHIQNKFNVNYKNIHFESYSFLFNHEGKSLYYTADLGDSKDFEIFADQNIDIMISELNHIKVDDVFSTYENLSPSKIYLTHFQHSDYDEIVNRISSNNLENVILTASDGLEIEI